MNTTETLRVLIYPKADIYIGQCLEHDLCVRGRTVQDVRRRISHTVLAYQQDGYDFFALPAAPKGFFEQWDGASEPPFKVESEPLMLNFELRAA